MQTRSGEPKLREGIGTRDAPLPSSIISNPLKMKISMKNAHQQPMEVPVDKGFFKNAAKFVDFESFKVI